MSTSNVAHVEGDDLLDRVDGLRPHLDHLDTGAPLTADPVSANAYLGGWGIARALADGADVVVCPRVTDAAVVVGPAAWWWGWAETDWDRLAGAVTAGHVIECGAQTTGGNFAFFTDLEADLSKPLGFPIAEVDEDGSCVITKHPGTGGRLTVETVTAQLLYEIQTPSYANPDVITRFDTIRLDEVGRDRVRISGVRGEPAPATAKVAINFEGGFRNRMTFVLTGLEQEAKARWTERALLDAMGGADAVRDAGIEVHTRFVPAPSDGADQERSSGLLHVQVRSADERAVGRAFSSAAVELALASYPGYFTTTPPGPASAFGVYWPALVPVDEIDQVVVAADGTRTRIEPAPTGPPSDEPIVVPTVDAEPATIPAGTVLGEHFGARSGDKGGNANIGIWARDDAGYAWLRQTMTPDTIRSLIPEAAGLDVHRPRAAQPAGAEHRARRLPRRGRRQLDGLRPPGQGPRRVPPSRSVTGAASRCAEVLSQPASAT